MSNITANFSADFSKFFDAVQKADAKLADFMSDAAKVQDRLSKMADALSGRALIQQATLMAEAVDRIGGVSKLTESELQRLGTKAQEAAEKMRLMGVNVPKNLQDLADAASKADKSTSDLGISFGKLVASYVSGQAIIAAATTAFHDLVGGISASITAAGEAEKTHAQLVAALRAQGTAIPSVISAFEGYATALQKTTIYQDDALEGAEALLVQVGNVMPKDMEKALKATTDLASGLGKDLNEAALLVAKAAEGNTTALRKAGVQFDQTKGEALSFAEVLTKIEEKFGGQGAALASTYEGRLKQLANTWNNVEESIGRVITQNATVLSAFATLNDLIDKNTGELNNNAAANRFVSEIIIKGVQGVALLGQALDVAQTGAAAFVIGLRTLGIGVLTLEEDFLALAKATTSPFDIAQRQAIDAATASIQKQIDARRAANAALTEGSAAVGTALQTYSAQANALADDLAKTSGQTKKLADITDGATDAWSRNTVGVNKETDAMKEARKEGDYMAAVFQKLIFAQAEATNKAVQWVRIGGDMADTSEQAADRMSDLDQTATQWIRLATLMPGQVGAAKKAIDNVRDGVESLNEKLEQARALGGIADIFGNLAPVGGTLGTISKQVQQVAGNLANVSAAMAHLDDNGFNTQDLLKVAAGWVGVATAIYSVIKNLKDAKAAQDALNRATTDKGELDRQFGTIFSDTLGRQVQETRDLLAASTEFKAVQASIKANGGGLINEEQVGEALHLADAIQELGGAAALSAAQVGTVQDRVGLLIQLLGYGGNIGRQAGQSLSDVFGEFGDTLQLTQDEANHLFQEIQRGGQVGSNAADAVNTLFGDENLKGAAALAAAIKHLSDFLAGNVPTAAQAAANGIEDAFRNVTITIPVHYEVPELPGDNITPASGYATGGRVPEMPSYFGSGGRLLAFIPKGTDRVPAMLSPGETVRTKAQEAALWNGNGAVNVTVNVTQPFGTPEQIGQAINKALSSTNRTRRLVRAG